MTVNDSWVRRWFNDWPNWMILLCKSEWRKLFLCSFSYVRARETILGEKNRLRAQCTNERRKEMTGPTKIIIRDNLGVVVVKNSHPHAYSWIVPFCSHTYSSFWMDAILVCWLSLHHSIIGYEKTRLVCKHELSTFCQHQNASVTYYY